MKQPLPAVAVLSRLREIESPLGITEQRELRFSEVLIANTTRRHRGRERAIALSTYGLLGLAAAVAGLYFGSRKEAAPSRVGATVADVEGAAFALPAGGREMPAVSGQALHPGDSLHVAHGSARFTLTSGAGAILSGPTVLGLAVAALPTEERLLLESGTISLSVPKLAPTHALTVVTPHVEVRVVGTRFSVTVARDPSGRPLRTCVSVSEGRVRLGRVQPEHELGAPGRWSSDGRPCAESRGPSDHASVPGPTGSVVPRERSLEPPRSRSRASQALPAEEVMQAPQPIEPAPSAGRAPPVAAFEDSTLAEQNRLFLSGVTARRGGRPDLALAIFQNLIERYPDTPFRTEVEREMALARQTRP